MKPVGALLLLLVGSGCAHLPDATLNYYLAKSEVKVKVTRTLACDKSDNVFVQNTVEPSSSHSADTSTSYPVPLKQLRGAFTDSDFTFELTVDGRIKGINSVSEGKGEDILKAAINVASTAAALGVRMKSLAKSDDCDYIRANGADGKTLTLVYAKVIDLADPKSQDVPADAMSEAHATRLANRVGSVCAILGAAKTVFMPVKIGDDLGAVTLKARQPALVSLEVKGDPGCAMSLGTSEVLVAQKGFAYDMPIPKAALFGKATFVAKFDDSGALTWIQYGSAPGAGQALNVINSALIAAKDSTANKAAELNAEADLIAAQQRVAKCRADKTACN